MTAAAFAGGCAPRPKTVIDAFPKSGAATPWTLQDQVWSGTFDEAASALGDDAERWRGFEPQRVWLAIYRHDRQPKQTLTVRVFALATPAAARQALDAIRQFEGAAPLDIGQGGCWRAGGLAYVHGRLAIEIFGADNAWASQTQAAFLATYIEKFMPAGVADDPR
jgi:hypothetical protein